MYLVQYKVALATGPWQRVVGVQDTKIIAMIDLLKCMATKQ